MTTDPGDLASSVLALAAAVACWPGRPVRRRADALLAGSAAGSPARFLAQPTVSRAGAAVRSSLGRWQAPRRPVVVLPASVVAGMLAAGVGGAVAALLLSLTVLRTRRETRAERDHAEATAGLADGLASFAAEVRSGAPLPGAAEAAGTDAHPTAARVLALVAATARLGGDVPAAVRAAGRREPVAGPHLERLATVWALADRHGIALAGPTEAVARDLRARARTAGQLRAQLAGPRATAGVLAVLPVLGVLLGESIGARPWQVLSGSVLGQSLLVVGVGLACAGVLWTGRIVAGVSR